MNIFLEGLYSGIFNLMKLMAALPGFSEDFRKLSNLVYKEDIYREQKKFLLKCRFYNLHPKHIDFITQKTKTTACFPITVKLNKIT